MSGDLRRRADLGDAEAQFDLGFSDYENGNLDGAFYWWEKCAYSLPNAAINLVQLLNRPSDRNRFLKWLDVLAHTHKDPWGVAILGTLLCGTEHKLWKDAGFSPLPPEEREKGLAYIKLGTEHGSEEDFQFMDYNAFAEAHYKRPGRSSFHGCKVEEIELGLKYQEKALSMAQKIAMFDPMVAQLAKMYEKSVENIKGGLDAIKKAEDSDKNETGAEEVKNY